MPSWLHCSLHSITISSLPVLFVSGLPSAPHMISLSTASLMFQRPGPGTLLLLLTLTEEPLSPTTSQTLRATTLYQPSCCFCHSLFASWVLQSLLCVGPPLLSVEHRWPPPHFPMPCFSFGPVMWRRVRQHCEDVWVCRVEKFKECRKLLGNASICRLNISSIFPYLKFVVFIARHVLQPHQTVQHCIHLK